MRHFSRVLAVTCLCLSALSLIAAPAPILDTTFNSGGVDQSVTSLALQSDGKILVDYNVPNDANTYKLDAWKRSGHTFVAPGLGFQAAFTKKGGPIAEFRYMQFLSPNVPVLAFQLGYSLGF